MDSPWGHRESDMTEVTEGTRARTHTHTLCGLKNKKMDLIHFLALLVARSVKNPPARQETAYTGDPGSKNESGRCPGEGNDNLLQYSC